MTTQSTDQGQTASVTPLPSYTVSAGSAEDDASSSRTSAAIALAARGDHDLARRALAGLADYVPALLLLRYLNVLGDGVSAPGSDARELLDRVKAAPAAAQRRAADFFRRYESEAARAEAREHGGAAAVGAFLAGSWRDHVLGDLEGAVELWRCAADGNDVAAIYNLAWSYDNGSGLPRAPAEGVRLYRVAAERGYPPALNNLAVCYRNGHGVPRDLAEAARYYSEAVRRGSLSALFNLAYAYDQGEGVPRDKREAVRLYRDAAARGHVGAAYNLALCLKYDSEAGAGGGDDAEALRLVEQAAASGDPDSLALLGRWLVAGDGVEQDARRGAELLREATRLGCLSSEQALQSLFVVCPEEPDIVAVA
eukprot:m51a1_g14096 hypothetical protein (367) ;mRNA; f:75972-77227